VPRRRRQSQGLERVLGAPALFATAYGNVGSSIYYALGLTAGIALGLTPIVFIVSGLIFAATAATYAEGTVRYPEAGGSASFARHAFNELVSFFAAWAQMLNYVITVAISVIFVPHYLSIFWEPLRTNPWDIIVGIALTWLLVAINVVGVAIRAGGGRRRAKTTKITANRLVTGDRPLRIPHSPIAHRRMQQHDSSARTGHVMGECHSRSTRSPVDSINFSMVAAVLSVGWTTRRCTPRSAY